MRIVDFYFSLVTGWFRGSVRFVRLTLRQSGKIWFYDKKYRKLFSVQTRGLMDSCTADQIYTQHDYDLSFLRRFRELEKVYDDIVSSGKRCLIIDCGANIGLSLRYFAEEFPDATVVGVEPDADNCRLARLNCQHLENIYIEQCAIGASIGRVSIDFGQGEPNAYRTFRGRSEGDIAVVTISDIIRRHQDCELFLTKIDIEGFEDDLFSHNTEWIRCSPLVIIEPHDWLLPREGSCRNFLQVVGKEDRDFILRGENVFSIDNQV